MAEGLTKAGRYQVVSELGRGSMGIVYQGFDPLIGRTVAIKTLLVEGLGPADFQEYKARFQREAQAAGVLTHPNIVTVYDFGEDEGVLYLAMEFLEGKSLQQLIEEQNILPVETIIPMCEQVCSALDHAHSHKIVHRDIKPANIMILNSGLVKVTDFGIAKMMSMGMTQAGQILGTPNYMSPEQVKGRPVDGRSDIFSLGVILYELVTGEKPFGGQNITTVIYKIINENPIPPRELDATIPPGLSYVISKALAKSPEERYQTCRELAEDLKNYRNLGGAGIVPSATVIIKVPPIQTSPGEPVGSPPPVERPRAQGVTPARGEQQPVRPTARQVVAPVKREPKATSPVVWVLATLLAVGALGGGYYFFRMKRPVQVVESNPPGLSNTATPTTSVPSAPGGNPPAATPAETTTASPTVIPPTEPAATSQAPAPEPEVSTQVAPARTAPEPTRNQSALKFGQLIVTANVAGARISIDGKSDPNWIAPRTFSDLPAGTHLVTLSKEGYSDLERSVTIEGGRTNSISAELTVPSGEINIVTTPPGVEVLIDGRSYGTSPVRATVRVGQHTYTIKRPGTEPFESTFTMKDGAIMTRKVDLGGGAVASSGIVEVRTIPPGATVYADGTPVGQTPTSFRLAAGRHRLTISLTGFRPLQREIDVPASGSIPINESLSRQ